MASTADEIPADILERAQAALDHAFKYELPMLEVVGRQIMLERERCASIAVVHGGRWLLRLSAEVRTSKFFRDKVTHKIETAEAIAADIRKPVEA